MCYDLFGRFTGEAVIKLRNKSELKEVLECIKL